MCLRNSGRFIAVLLAVIVSVQTLHAQIIRQPFAPGLSRAQQNADRMRQEMEQRMRELRERTRFPGSPIQSPVNSPRIPGNPIGIPANPIAAPNAKPGAKPIAAPTRPVAPTPPPQPSGLKFSPGPVTHSSGESILVRRPDGTRAVGRLHVTVGKTKIVMMPDGQLESFDLDDTRPTTDKFKPLTMNQIEKQILDDPKLRGFKTLKSKRFLYVYNCSEIFIESTRTIQESMYPGLKKWFGKSGIRVRTPELPLVVIAFATEDQYQDYRRMPDGVVAYYDTVSNNVLMYERSKLSDHAPEIAVKNAISTVAHEGAHQILHNIGVQQRLSRWPMWLSEGLAEFFAPTSTTRGARWSGLAASNHLRMKELSRFAQANRGKIGNGDQVKKITSADRLTSLGYAYSWALIHMQAQQHSKELYRCIRQCSNMRPLDGSPAVASDSPSATAVFEKFFGDDYADTEQELTQHLSRLDYVDPVLTQPHYIVQIAGQVMMTSSPEKVKELQKMGPAKVSRYPNRPTAEAAFKAIAQ